MTKLFTSAALALGVAISSPAYAATTVGGYTFADNAFADQLTASSGDYTTSGGSVSSVLTDLDPNSWAFTFDAGAFVELAFTDNLAINGAGNDIVLFELGIPDSWTVVINGITHSYSSSATSETNLNAAAFDLSDFGIAVGGTVSTLRLSFPVNVNAGTVASTSLVGALNSVSAVGAVPEPGTWAMMLLGFAGIGMAARRQRRTVQATA